MSAVTKHPPGTTIASALKSALYVNLAVVERLVHPRQPALSSVRNFLLLQYQTALGSAIHATPLIAAVHAAIPGARIAAAASSGIALEVLRGNPGIERLVSTPSPLRDLLPAARAIRSANVFGRERFAVLLTRGNKRSRIVLATLLSGSPTRVGFTQIPELVTEPMHYDPRISQIANNLRIIEALGHGAALLNQLQTDPDLAEPSVYFSQSDLQAAQTLLRECRPEGAPVTAFVMQGSGGQRTGWHDDRFAHAIRHAESLGHRTIFLGTANDVPTVDRIIALAHSSGRSLAGRTTIQQLTALLCLCDLLVSVDTGTMHVGRAAGLPMVVLGPSWQKAVEWLPLGKPYVRILRGEDRDSVPANYALDEISSDSVIAAMQDLAARYPASEAKRRQRVSRLLVGPVLG